MSDADAMMSEPAIDSEQIQAKRLANLKAELALRGFELHQTMAGTYIVRRWNLSRVLASLDDVEAFAEKAGT